MDMKQPLSLPQLSDLQKLELSPLNLFTVIGFRV